MDGIIAAVCSVIVFSSFSFIATEESCMTPNQQPGECKIISECSVLYQILQHRPIPSASADYLRRSHCGFQGTLPKVCCPNQPTPPPTSRPPIDDEDVYDRNQYNHNNNNQHNGNTDTSNSAPPVTSDLLPDGTVCGIDSQNRIYGGETADLDEFPWMALIEYEKPNRKRGFYCGGVLINKRYVLTAAHCLKGKDLPRNWKLVSVRLGEYNTETEEDCVSHGQGYGEDCAPPPLNIPVSERITHENYDPYDQNQYNDIALLRLSKDVPYSDYVKPICLPKTSEELVKTYTGKKLFVAGWGKTENASESTIKLKLQVPVKSNTDCSSVYNVARVKLGQGQLCAGGEKGRDSCRGDSGGPLMTISADQNGEINWYAVGIVSFGPSPCGMENWPGVYTRVNKYVSWIVNKLQR